VRRFALPAVLLALLFAPSAGHAKPQLTIPSGWPKAIVIPRIALHAAVDSDPLTRLKPLDQQPPWSQVLWFSRGAKPGAPGRALIYGHLDTYTGPDTFWNLHELQPGDKLTFTYAHGTLTFQVRWLHEYPVNAVPYPWIYGPGHQRGVVLVTCSGSFHGLNNGGYDHRLVVYARLLLPDGTLD
jgi:hypothetical protein